MKIERLLQDPNGTFVTLEGQRYDFLPQSPLGPYVCEVSNDQHAERLLNISYCYRAVVDAVDPVPAPTEPLGGWNITDDGVAFFPPITLGATPAPAPEPPRALGDMTDDELREAYAKAFDKKPHPNTGREKLISSLSALPPQ